MGGAKTQEETEEDSSSPSTETDNTAKAVTVEPEKKPEEPKTDSEHLEGLMKQCRISAKMLKRGVDFGPSAIAEIVAKVKGIEKARA
jgi:hypothetical protein